MMPDFNDLIGKPFDPDSYGPDAYSCYGLAVEVFRRFGIEIPRTDISVCACKAASMREIDRHVALYWQALDKPETPCGLIIKSLDPLYAHHTGVYIGQGRIIHTKISRDCIIDRVHDWKDYIIGIYRYAGNDHSRH